MIPVGTAGGSVMLTGTNLSVSTTVTVGGAAVAVRTASADGTRLTVQVPAGVVGTTVPVTVTNPDTAGATGMLVYTTPAVAPPAREMGTPAGMPAAQPPPRPVAPPVMGMPVPLPAPVRR